jgi:hypothetical protein
VIFGLILAKAICVFFKNFLSSGATALCWPTEVLNLNQDGRRQVWHGYGNIYDELLKKIAAAVVAF